MRHRVTLPWRGGILTLIAAIVMAIAFATAPAVAGHGGSSSPELTVVGHLSKQDMGIPFGENVTDVWAFGNYAYLGTFQDLVCSRDFTGVHIVDISDPTSPTKVGFIASPPGTRANDVKVAHIDTRHFTGEILVHSNEPCSAPFLPQLEGRGFAFIPGQGGVAIYDVTDPTKPRTLKRNFLDFPVHNTYIYQQGDNAYMLVVDDVNERDVHIVDITKPQSPKEIAVTGAPDWPGLETIPNGNVFVHDVWAQEQTDGTVIAYLSYWDAGLVLLDITDPTNPTFLMDSAYPDPDPVSGQPPEGNSHVAVPNEDGSLVVMGDEDFLPGFLTSFSFDGVSFPAGWAVFGEMVDPSFSGPVHWTGGEGCSTSEFDRSALSGEIALIQRGTCFFSTKAANAQALGYAGYVVANSAAGGDSLILLSQGTRDDITIPGFFVGFSTGEIMKANEGGILAATGVFDGWGYMRVLDVSDTTVVELGSFATENVVANPVPFGDRTAHNVMVREGLAYWSWYAEGIRVVDFSECKPDDGPGSCTPSEVAHFVATDSLGRSDSNFWGVYLHDHPDGNTYILGSDRNTGLWIFNDVDGNG